MRALVYTASIPRYLLARSLGKRMPLGLLPLSLREVPEPEAPRGWEKAKVILSGICGSDIALLFGKSSPRLAPFFSFPAVLGHEIVAEVGGVLAAINPLLGCRERGFSPPCWACAQGEDGLCQNVAEGNRAPGGMLGYHRDFPGGWAERIVVHPARAHPLAPGIPPERGILAEPLAVVLRGLRLAQAEKNEPLLILGAGTLGLLALFGLKLSGYLGPIHVVAKHELQARLAQELGARVHRSPWEATRLLGAKSYPAPLRPPAWRGGFPFVIDAAGTKTSLDQALWAVREGGTVLLLGAPGEVSLDLSPLWFRSVRLIGTYTYSEDDFRKAVETMRDAPELEKLVTHTFPLADYRAALKTVLTRRGIKVAFRP